jgi:hypothetical protein
MSLLSRTAYRLLAQFTVVDLIFVDGAHEDVNCEHRAWRVVIDSDGR